MNNKMYSILQLESDDVHWQRYGRDHLFLSLLRKPLALQLNVDQKLRIQKSKFYRKMIEEDLSVEAGQANSAPINESGRRFQ